MMRRNIGFTAKLLCPLFILALMNPVGAADDQRTGQDQIKAVLEQLNKIGLKLTPTTPQQVINTTDNEIAQFSNVSMVATIADSAATAFLRLELKSQSTFQSPHLTFSNQSAVASLNFVGPLSLGPLGIVDIKAQLHAELAPAVVFFTNGPNAEFDVSFAVTKLDTTILSINRNGQPLPGLKNEIAEAIANGVLVPTQAALNRVVLKLPTTVSSDVHLSVSQRPGIVTTFEPKQLTPKIQLTRIAYLLDGGRLSIAAEEGGAKKMLAPASGISFDTLRADFQKLIATTNSEWLNQEDFSVYVQGEFIQRICLNSIIFQSNTMELKANLNAQAQATAAGHIKFTPLNVAGHLTCFAPFDLPLSFSSTRS